MNVIFAANRFTRPPIDDGVLWLCTNNDGAGPLSEYPSAPLIDSILAEARLSYPAARAVLGLYWDNASGNYLEIYYSAEADGCMEHPERGHVDIDGYHYLLRFVPDELPEGAA